MKAWPLILIFLSIGARAAIEDNSFLITEAFTQGENQIQFIQNFNSPPRENSFYGATLELPLKANRHQLGTSLNTDDAQNFGITYSYQSHKHSVQQIGLIAPTEGRSSRGVGLLQALTLSLNEQWVNHLNLGLVFGTDTTLLLGTSFVYLLHDRFNLLTEVLLETEHDTTITLNPGLRSSFPLKWKNSEVVPGIAFPMEIIKDPVGFGVFVYLSIESNFI